MYCPLDFPTENSHVVSNWAKEQVTKDDQLFRPPKVM